MITHFIQGFCMALADSVPGVSGGTVAFLLGFYDEFINSINSIFGHDNEKRKNGIIFLIKIGIGWVSGFIIAALILASVFEKNIYFISSVFIGFIIFAIPVVIMQEKEHFTFNIKNLCFLILGAIIVFAVTYFNPVGNAGGIDLSNLSIGLSIYIFISGAIAISAMVLPGISGSSLLLIFGLYLPIMSRIKDFLHLNFEGVPVLIIFGLGVITGIFCVISTVKKCLEKYRPQTLNFVIGLMIGSLYAIKCGPLTLTTPMPEMTFQNFNIIGFLVGGIIIVIMNVMSNKK